MNRQILITAVAIAALGGTLAADDQSVEKATRFRVTTSGPATTMPFVPEADSPAVVEVPTPELGSAAQIEELGPYYWNNNADQVEELGPFYWNQSADQIEELGCCYNWNQNADQVEELGPYYWNESAEQINELGCCYIWANNAAEIED